MTDADLSGTGTDSSVTPSESHILYVDPDHETATSIVSTLEERTESVSVSVATTAADALSLLTERPIECIISEYTLPDGDGLDLFASVRTQYSDLPFILYTAAGSEAIASDALSAGVTDYFSKQRGGALDQLTRTVETILEERHATRRLTEVEADEFKTLVDDIRDHAIFILDPEGYISSWNSGAEQLKGYRQEEILGKHFSAFYPAEATERGKPSKMLAEARARGRTTDEGWRVRKDGTQFWASVVISALRDDDGAIRGFAKFTRDLTEQRERERQVREQHELTERILDAVPVGVAVHLPNGDLIRANSRAQEILEKIGTEELEEGEEPAIDSIYDANGEPMEEADMPPMRVFETGDPVTDMEIAIEGSDGTLRWFSVNAVPMFDQNGEDIQRIITTGKDITTLKEREAELEEIHGELRATVGELQEANHQLEVTQNRFEALTENSSVAVLSIDGTSTIQFANDTIEDIFGYDPEDLVGESLTTVMPDRYVDNHLQGISRYIESGERHLDWEWIEMQGVHRDGHEIDLGLSFGETQVEGDHLFTAVIRDITEQKERKRELERRREELNELVDELERSNAELEQFAYAVSHDLKEPLRTVRSYVELLERRYGEKLDEEAEEFIGFAANGATRMQHMIEDILKFSQVGRDQSSHEPVDCNAVLNEICDMLSIEERCEVTVEPLPTVWGNRTQLTKVFQNLVSNAITHSEGEVTVRVSAERQGDTWCFSIADDGPGIPPEQQEHVFELFNAAGSTGGTGVGLAICRKVVEYHGGTIDIDSTPGEGTTFSFTLPDAESVGPVD